MPPDSHTLLIPKSRLIFRSLVHMTAEHMETTGTRFVNQRPNMTAEQMAIQDKASIGKTWRRSRGLLYASMIVFEPPRKSWTFLQQLHATMLHTWVSLLLSLAVFISGSIFSSYGIVLAEGGSESIAKEPYWLKSSLTMNSPEEIEEGGVRKLLEDPQEILI